MCKCLKINNASLGLHHGRNHAAQVTGDTVCQRAPLQYDAIASLSKVTGDRSPVSPVVATPMVCTLFGWREPGDGDQIMSPAVHLRWVVDKTGTDNRVLTFACAEVE